jgi:hypothetical protein
MFSSFPHRFSGSHGRNQSQKRGHVASAVQILTIFTTVGFGDMSAYTTGETLYADWTMSLGRRDLFFTALGEKTCG